MNMKNYITKSSPSPKVVILSDQPKDRISGPNLVISGLYPYLEKEISISWKVCPGINLFGKLSKLPHSLKSILASISSFLKLLNDKEIKECKIINGHGISAWLPTIWLSKLFRKTSLITLHETYEYTKLNWFFGGGKLARWVWRYTLKNVDYLIDLGHTVKLEKTFFIPNGVDTKKFKPKEVRKDKKTVLFVGRMSPEKGFNYFIEASKIVKTKLKERVEFLAVTGSASKDKEKLGLINQIKQKGVEIKLEQRIPHDAMPKIYQKSDVLVISSLAEAFPLTIFEAMSCGTPVVATNVGGIPVAIKDGLVGFLVPPKNPQTIAQKVIKILEDDRLRNTMRKNCLEWVKNFTWEKVAQKYLETYRKISQEKYD